MKLFYNKSNKKEVIDVSDNKTLNDIKIEFGDGEYEEVLLLPNENYRINGDEIVKYDFRLENNQLKEDEKVKKQEAANRIMVKLGLSDDDIEDLKSVL